MPEGTFRKAGGASGFQGRRGGEVEGLTWLTCGVSEDSPQAAALQTQTPWILKEKRTAQVWALGRFSLMQILTTNWYPSLEVRPGGSVKAVGHPLGTELRLVKKRS